MTVRYLSFVPLLMVTHSRMVVLSPISAVVISPSNFKSWGSPEITAPGKILQFFPIRAPFIMVTLDPIHVPSPITTSLCIVLKGSITTLSAIFASGCIYDKGCIILYGLFHFYYLCHQFGFTHDFLTYHTDTFHTGYASAYRLQQLTTEYYCVTRMHLVFKSRIFNLQE